MSKDSADYRPTDRDFPPVAFLKTLLLIDRGRAVESAVHTESHASVEGRGHEVAEQMRRMDETTQTFLSSEVAAVRAQSISAERAAATARCREEEYAVVAQVRPY